ncbi:MAG: DUF2281 domain-containing protein [Chloroflexota bacterium]
MDITKDIIIDALDELPADHLGEVLDFVLFLQQRRQTERKVPQKLLAKTVPAHQLKGLVGLVAWGGDALADTERLYEA